MALTESNHSMFNCIFTWDSSQDGLHYAIGKGKRKCEFGEYWTSSQSWRTVQNPMSRQRNTSVSMAVQVTIKYLIPLNVEYSPVRVWRWWDFKCGSRKTLLCIGKFPVQGRSSGWKDGNINTACFQRWLSIWENSSNLRCQMLSNLEKNWHRETRGWA